MTEVIERCSRCKCVIEKSQLAYIDINNKLVCPSCAYVEARMDRREYMGSGA